MSLPQVLPDETEVEVVREVVRLSEKHLDAQLAIIGALAQRAGALAGMFGAGSLAMLAVELSLLNLLKGELTIWAYCIALIAPAVMFSGCAYCGLAAGTSLFNLPGTMPRGWVGNSTAADVKDALLGEVTNYQGYIDENNKIIKRHARSFRRGLVLGLSSPIVLVAVGAAYIALRKSVD